MRNFTLKCVILGHKDISENHKLVFLYNEEWGKIKAIAKGARKMNSKFTGHLETLNFCTISFYKGPHSLILQEIISNKNYRPSATLNTARSALQIAEITDKLLFEEQKLENLLELIEACAGKIQKSKRPELIAIAYIIKLLNKVGLLPDFLTIQSKTEIKYLKFFEYLKHEELNQIEKIKLEENEYFKIKQILKNIIEKTTEKKLHSLSY